MTDGMPGPVGGFLPARRVSAPGHTFPAHEVATGVPEELVVALRAEVAGQLAAQGQADEAAGRPSLSVADRHVLAEQLTVTALDAYAAVTLAGGGQLLSPPVEGAVVRRVLDGLFALGGFQPLLDDPTVENINANGCDSVWVRYADGRREQTGSVAGSDAELIELIRTVAARAGVEERRFDRASPRLSVQLADGSRLFAVMAVTGRPCVAIRRHRYLTVTADDLVDLGTLTPGLRAFLGAVVRARKNVLICGGTGVGKTTLLRALAADIPRHERLITIEDSLELGLDRDPVAHPDVVAMQAREANIEGHGEVSLAELVRYALRMSPDRVIVGEIRGPEVVPACNAMSQGTDGSMATLHASSSKGAFAKIAAYAAQGPERLPLEATGLLVAAAIHFVVHLDWAPDGRRVVSSVREVVGAQELQVLSNEVWRPGPDRVAVPGAPVRADTMAELVAAGYLPADGGFGESAESGGWWP
ncbi:CpaF family protein [Frankia sp. CiP3]|uniref:CpaF family protein n=1 Tax=Frankia sp. CiP3 TaxID=2880971 RepID=UPI001EF52EB0|nr:ATPase, T2SS/T4P/T4SS family [Frankia sp. CiP3]